MEIENFIYTIELKAITDEKTILSAPVKQYPCFI
jgi:hypothetical protein